MLENRRGTLTIVHEIEGAERVLAARRALKEARESLERREPPWTPNQLTRVHFLRWFLLWDWEVVDDAGNAAAPGSRRCLLVFLSCFDGSAREHLRELVARAPAAVASIFENVTGYRERNAEQTVEWLLSHARYADAVHVGAPKLGVQRILGDARLVEHVRRLLAEGPDAWLVRSGWVTRHQSFDAPRGWQGWDVAAALRRWIPSERSGFAALVDEPPRPRQLKIPLPGFAILAVLAPLPALLLPPPASYVVVGTYYGVLFGLGLLLAHPQSELGEEQELTRPGALPLVREDEERATQNPMSLVTRVRDGFLNRLGLRVGLFTIQLLSRFHFNRGSLGPIYTIHFARWFIVRHPERRSERYLVFESNWDFSWESYLDDFTDGRNTRKALNLVWRHAVGFPRIRGLLDGGCDDSGPFLAWVRRHQVPTHAWYTAYPALDLRSVLQNELRRDGILRQARKTKKEKEWLLSW